MRDAKLERMRVFACAIVLLAGCAGQSEHLDDRDWTVEHGAEQEGSWREAESLFGTAESEVGPSNNEPRSVRHDLAMGQGSEPDARCACIEVVAGRPGDKKFAWAGEPPIVSPNDMVIALRPHRCEGAKQDRRPSIQAVDRRGNDVVVVIEELTVQRPQALGAVIPRPLSGGELYVAPAGASVPFARAQGGGRCRVPVRGGEQSKSP